MTNQRTLAAGTTKKVGEQVRLFGWVDSIRDHGKITFLDLRDRSTLIQCVGKNLPKVSPESVVEIEGKVVKRPEKLINPKLETGEVEVQIEKLHVISLASEIPIPINTEGLEIDENVRLKFRYLDLRRPRMARNLRLRSKVTTFIRNWLTKEDFVEIETPILTKTTPEGARDFIVPSRLQFGKFYALPQSPQQYKQLLMVAGFERYFQIARCFRDEDPRADRAYGEFTQLDLEMSYVTQEDILNLTEELFTQIIKEIFPEKKITKSPWPRLSHKEAREKYGSDRPDLRKDKENKDELAFSWTLDFPLFTEQTQEDYFHGSGSAKWAPSHHMFTAPHPDDVKLLDSAPGKVRGLQHDLVLNGYEVGGGSVRIHQSDIQKKIFELIGFSEKQQSQFEHMLTAFSYGVPPHGGIAPGIDRFLMVTLGEPSVREVMAYPMTSGGQTAVMDAPSEAAEEQLKELGISVKKRD
jgi:aspartyl-tRNA synthetase